MYKVSVRDGARVVLERTLFDQPTQKDCDALLDEVGGDAFFIDVCRTDSDFGDLVAFQQELEFEVIQ